MHQFRRTGSALAIISSMAFGTAALAEEAADSGPSVDRDTIVVTATRIPVTIADVPATVTVITDEEIADTLATDIRDVLRYEPGVAVRRAPARFGAAFASTGRGRNASVALSFKFQA